MDYYFQHPLRLVFLREQISRVVCRPRRLIDWCWPTVFSTYAIYIFSVPLEFDVEHPNSTNDRPDLVIQPGSSLTRCILSYEPLKLIFYKKNCDLYNGNSTLDVMNCTLESSPCQAPASGGLTLKLSLGRSLHCFAQDVLHIPRQISGV